MEVPEIIGVCAIIIGLIYRVPQIWLTYKTKSAKDLSRAMIWTQNISYILYIVYGVMKDDYIYYVSSGISLGQNFILLGMKWHFETPLETPPEIPIV
jgi:MtN3 and saliva related transmembrane protein